MLKKYLKIFVVGIFLFVGLSSSAHAAPAWWPIVPCGLNQQPAGATLMDDGPNGTKVPHNYTVDCNQCDLILLFKNMIDLVINVIVPTVGSAIFIGAGFWILISARSGKPEGVNQARGVMTNAAIGIAIILCAWLITTLILKTLSNNPNPQNPWYSITCTVGDLKNLADATVPSIGGDPTVATPAGTTTQTNNGTGTSTGTGGQCVFTGINLCQGTNKTPFSSQTLQCGGASCSSYSGTISKYATQFGISANLLKAVMVKESGCDATQHSNTSYGLMELQPATAILVSQYCGVDKNAIDGQWLINHPTESICLSAAYLHSVSAGQCGSDPRNIAAGYNAGPGYCAPSVDCADTSCSNETTRKWECPYEDPQHQTCNVKLNETKDYAVKVLYCTNNPGF